MQARMTKRLQKDLEAIQKNYKDQFQVTLPKNDLQIWHIEFTASKETVFADEKFKLQFKFSPEYPIESPEVIFIGKVPDHEHIYSNGFICLSILYDEWSPALTVASVCLSIISMLSSAQKKARPFNDAEFCKRSQGRGPKAFLWSYDDTKC
ncbi:ubiquitin-conjugating enzyme e2w, putative [Ichthyophthirius multifiliis]|uniref:Ubiquitin-conjugating enzyme e2w, putative n=1 Tax=Ichthyophthirius multifiliis TaxID=5932 RepID=G0QVX1_ICHMU|nr:ubiquitin-conjugating enzyme e2w, putative [Ichthyophthirius multifiliis]EGR30636.1 ubiquitin-conjugating enzyme e2w, putative [Ichthyophthirius multifiliis]|eukprot:XP_004032223.1 ubiquitin-conjugating enzyme e2w, putative [Ichthyophthirius multifiliis]